MQPVAFNNLFDLGLYSETLEHVHVSPGISWKNITLANNEVYIVRNQLDDQRNLLNKINFY